MPGMPAQVRDGAGAHHEFGERGRLLGRHAAKEDRHQERGALVVAPAALRGALDEGGDLIAGQRMAVALPRR